VSIEAGAHRFGPENATLRVKTGRRGAAAKAGHDLAIEVTSWQATLDVAEDGGRVGLELDADPGSLRVREGIGGVQPLKDEDREEILQTIDDQVLKRRPIKFRSKEGEVADGGRRLRVRGELEMAGQGHDVDFELDVTPEGGLAGRTTLRQTDWGIEPYSGLFGALKVADEVEVLVETT
jgi:hypothetical protein